MENAPDQKPQDASPAMSRRALLALAMPLVVILLAGTAFVYWANDPKYNLKGEQADSTPTAEITATPTTSAADQAPLAADSATGTVAASPAPIFGSSDYRRGDAAKLFLNDEIRIWENDFPAFRVKATQFTDSRCPPDVQCIWAGERGIEIEVTLEGTEAKPQRAVLAESTRRSAQTFGLKMSLVAIDDAKGGIYAEIKFE
jgi:hypothetical protein